MRLQTMSSIIQRALGPDRYLGGRCRRPLIVVCYWRHIYFEVTDDACAGEDGYMWGSPGDRWLANDTVTWAGDGGAYPHGD